MPDIHSSLPPSSSKMWINCPPSAKKNAAIKDEGSSYSAEGTDAHLLAAYKLLKALGREAEDPTENLSYFNQEMEECADGYAGFVGEAMAGMEDPAVMVEQRVSFDKYAPGAFGTADCILIGGGRLHIIDLKYGKGIPVPAGSDEDGVNTQLACYALGALEAFDGIYDIDTVSMSIYQPRLNVAETYSVTKEALVSWGKEVLAPAAEKAAKGEGEYRAGSHCQFCKVKNTCRKRAEFNLEMARYDFAKPDELEDEEIEAILARADEFISWANGIKEYALEAAIGGKSWSDFKLVEGRSVRKYTNEGDVVKAVEGAGFDPYEKKVLGVTAMTKLLGKKRFDELLGGLITKPPGAPTLVPMSDKRSALKATAKEDFKEEK